MKVFSKHFFISWILASVIMFALSFVWHGFILNDFESISYSMGLFYALASVVYLVIGFVLTFVYAYIGAEESKTFKGLLVGGALGFFIYLIAFTLGVSFKSNGMEHIVVDFVWQMAEQGIGGALVAFIYVVAARHAKILEEGN